MNAIALFSDFHFRLQTETLWLIVRDIKASVQIFLYICSFYYFPISYPFQIEEITNVSDVFYYWELNCFRAHTSRLIENTGSDE